MPPDTSLFSDVADALGIAHPAIVEKDYYAVQLLKLLSTLEIPGYTLVFAGGTCLAKVHQNIWRMSEDIDIKLVPEEKTRSLPRENQRQLRRDVHQKIIKLIQASDTFKFDGEPKKRNEGRFQQFLIQYPTHYARFKVLRPHLQLELTEPSLLQPFVTSPLRSLYAEVAGQTYEVDQFTCVTIEATAAEKFISLLHRTATVARNPERAHDPALIRHVYDLHLIMNQELDPERLKDLVHQVIETDVNQFGNQHPEFRANPTTELWFGFEQLKQDPVHQQRYKEFIGPLVYHPEPADWDTAFTSLQKMVQAILGNNKSARQ